MLEMAALIAILVVGIMIKSRVADTADYIGVKGSATLEPVVNMAINSATAGELKSSQMMEEVAFDSLEVAFARNDKYQKMKTKAEKDGHKDFMAEQEKLINKIANRARNA